MRAFIAFLLFSACAQCAELSLAMISPSSERLSVDFPDVEKRGLLLQIAEVAGITVTLPEELSGRMSLKLADVTWQMLYDVILQPDGFDYYQQGDVVTIVRREELDRLPPRRIEVELFFQTPGEMKEYLSKRFEGKVRVDCGRHAIHVSVPVKWFDAVTREIHELDDPNRRLSGFPRLPNLPESIPEEMIAEVASRSATDRSFSLTTHVFVVRKIDAALIRPYVSRVVPTPGLVALDPRSNAVVVTGTASQCQVAQIIVSYLDDIRWYKEQAAEPGATDNPDDAQRFREDH